MKTITITAIDSVVEALETMLFAREDGSAALGKEREDAARHVLGFVPADRADHEVTEQEVA